MHKFMTLLFLSTAAAGLMCIRHGAPRPGSGLVHMSRPPDPVPAQIDKRRAEVLATATLSRIGVPLQKDIRGRVRWIEAGQGEFTDRALRCLPSLPLLEWLEIGGGKVTPEGMAHLKKCTALRRLYIHDVRLGDEALVFLSSLPYLEALSFQRTGISGRGLKYLRAGRRLKVLNLSGNEITNEDLTLIAGSAGLEVLALQDTKVTGAGLARLRGMKRLNELNLTNCRIADGDLKHFTSMPNLRIVYAAGCNLSEKAIEESSVTLPMLSIFP